MFTVFWFENNIPLWEEKVIPELPDNPKILEIGVWDGKSLLTWKDYFPNSTVVGIDIMDRCSEYTIPAKNIWVEIGSQNDLNFLKNVINKWGLFDMILDDGSHMNDDVIFSFKHWMNTV